MLGNYAIRRGALHISRLPRPLLVLVVALLTLATVAAASYIIPKLSDYKAWDELRDAKRSRFSPDYRVLAADTYPYGVSLWDTSNKRLLRSLSDGSLTTQLEFAPDGRLFAWSNQEYVFFYHLRSQRLVQTPAKAKGWIYAMAISPARTAFSSTNILATGGRVPMEGGAAVELWNMLAADSSHYTVSEFQDHEEVYSLNFSEDGKLLAAGLSDGAVHVWEISASALQSEFQAREVLTANPTHLSIYSIAISPDNNMVAVGDQGGEITLLSVQDGRLIRQLPLAKSLIQLLAFSPDSESLAVGREPHNGAEDGTVSIWRVSDGIQVWSSEAHSASLADLRFSSDGKRLTVGYSDGTLQTHVLP